jgi:hypothetical protein
VCVSVCVCVCTCVCVCVSVCVCVCVCARAQQDTYAVTSISTFIHGMSSEAPTSVAHGFAPDALNTSACAAPSSFQSASMFDAYILPEHNDGGACTTAFQGWMWQAQARMWLLNPFLHVGNIRASRHQNASSGTIFARHLTYPWSTRVPIFSALPPPKLIQPELMERGCCAADSLICKCLKRVLLGQCGYYK